MATTSFTTNFKLKKRDSNNFIIGMNAKAKPIFNPHFSSKMVDDVEYKKVVKAFRKLNGG